MADEKISITLKVSSGAKHDLDIMSSQTIAEVKKAVDAKCGVPAAQQRLIYRGKILKDEQTVASYNIASGHTLHVVQSSGAASQAAGPATTAAQSTAPSAGTASTGPAAAPNSAGGAAMPTFANLLGGLGGGAGAAGLGSGFPGLPGDLDPSIFAEMLQNPAMQSMMQSIMSNPQLMQSLVSSNPLLQQMAQQNPMLQQVLSNPEMLRSVLSPEVVQQAVSIQQELHNAGGPAAAAGTGANTAANPMADPLGAMLGGNLNMQEAFERIQRNPQVMQQMQRLAQSLQAGGGMGGLGGAGGLDQLFNMARAAGASGAAPAAAPGGTGASAETRFADQLKQLEDMGFIDKGANVMALNRTNGDVNAAIAWLLESGFGS